MAATGSGVINLSLLDAGVATSGGIGLGTGPSVSGQRPRNNNFTIEGVDKNNKGVTGPLLQPPNDAVDQFTVLQNSFLLSSATRRRAVQPDDQGWNECLPWPRV